MLLCPSEVVSYRNSTSNHNSRRMGSAKPTVVSYRNSTSNHNPSAPSIVGVFVVSYRNSTSNHNNLVDAVRIFWLYLIEILHQTTTFRTATSIDNSCILSKFYIKPQLSPQYMSRDRCCILSKFYIKPQLFYGV